VQSSSELSTDIQNCSVR